MLARGFADAALGPQAVFRRLLAALAQPGQPQQLSGDLPSPPPGMGRGLYAATLALVDFESPLWVAPELAGGLESLRFQTGATIVDVPGSAAFALAADGARLPALADFAQGTDAYPDRSTTVLLEVDALLPDTGWRLTGPGIETEARLAVRGLPCDFDEQWADNNARFPRGIDLLLCCGDRVAGLPRTTRIKEG